ncbi:MAG: hypothetical protein IT285_11840 [Bdellovibrionales bacterium]|nr:hypothetical protein [Bdellovibrionales bacterium]
MNRSLSALGSAWLAAAVALAPWNPVLAGEARDRQVDQVALSSQTKAIALLDRLLVKHRGSEQEPVFLARLADLHSQSAAIEFRLAHARSKSGKPDLARNRAALERAIAALDRLVGKFPHYPELHQAYFLRGKSFAELEHKANARRDYLVVSRKYSDSQEAVPANMALAEYAVDENRHAEAIGFLEQVERRPESPHYPFALYKLAWSHYNLQHVAASLGYLERQISWYRKLESARGRLDSSEVAILETALADTATFYFEGTQQERSKYGMESAFAYFRGLEKGPVLGRMLTRYAKLLRSRQDEIGLRRFKDLCLEGEPARPESLEVAVILYEHLLNTRDYKALPSVAQDFVRAHEGMGPELATHETHVRAEKLLLDTASQLEKLALRNKGIKGSEFLSESLVAVYGSFLGMVPGLDPRVYGVHYNLAETLFALDRYEEATGHYRWIVERAAEGKEQLAALKRAGLTERTASLRALGARYQRLRGEGVIPEKLQARSTKAASVREPSPLLAEWLGWLETHLRSYGFHDESLEGFELDAARSQYALGDFESAIPRLLTAARERPASKRAVPSATLVLDTRIADEDWATLYSDTGSLSGVKGLAQGEFGKRLAALSADAHFKITERLFAAAEHDEVPSRAEECMRLFHPGERAADCALMGAKSLVTLGRFWPAEQLFSRLIRDHAERAHAPEALLIRSGLRERRHALGEAAEDIRSHLALSAKAKVEVKSADELRRRALYLSWTAHDLAGHETLLSSPVICTPALAKDCARHRALAQLDRALARGNSAKFTEKELKTWIDASYQGPAELRALWGVAALEGGSSLGFRDQMLAVRAAAKNWSKLEPGERLTALPRVGRSVPAAFRLGREQIRRYAKLQANPASIQRRLGLVKEMEDTAGAAVKGLAFADVQVGVLAEVAEVYQDMADELHAVPVPKNLPEAEATAFKSTLEEAALPFEDKANDIRTQAFEIAGARGVTGPALDSVARGFFKANPSQAQALAQSLRLQPLRPDAMEGLLDTLAPHQSWESLGKMKLEIAADAADPSDPARLSARWIQAVRDGRWREAGRVSQLLRSVPEGRARPEPVVLEAYLLAASGLETDALDLLVEEKSRFGSVQVTSIYTVALSRAVRAYSRDASRKWVDRVRSQEPSGRLSIVLSAREPALAGALAVLWSGYPLDPVDLRALLTTARGTSSSEGASWVRARLRELGQSPIPAVAQASGVATGR